jgi:hypothetical protein
VTLLVKEQVGQQAIHQLTARLGHRRRVRFPIAEVHVPVVTQRPACDRVVHQRDRIGTGERLERRRRATRRHERTHLVDPARHPPWGRPRWHDNGADWVHRFHPSMTT